LKEENYMSEIIPGGFELHQEVGEGEMEIFKAALKGWVGVDYKPVAVASQVVEGTNYLFICTGKPVVAHPVLGLYAVKVFVKLPCNDGSNVELKGIEKLDIAALAK
jgi:hypothetical protein